MVNVQHHDTQVWEAFTEQSINIDDYHCSRVINSLLKHSNTLPKFLTEFSSISEMQACAGAGLSKND